MEKIILCYYGCGQEAKFIITKKNINCCSKNHSSCPANRKKNSEGLKKEHAKNPKDYSNRKYFAQNVSMLQEKYPEWYNAKIEKQKKTWKERYEAGLIKVKGTPHTEKSKEKIRAKRVAYLKTKSGNTAWEKRGARKPSYLERWFFESVLQKYKLNTLYDVVSEYCEYPYFIDYAFVNEKIAVELDGGVHFTNGSNRVQHDLKRDTYLKEKGWTVYRLPYFEVQNDEETTVRTFLYFLNSVERKEKNFESNLVKYNEYKSAQKYKQKKVKNLLKKVKKEQTNETEVANVEKVLNATHVDFSKLGWVQLVAKLTGKKHQRVNVWMKKYLPQFYEEKCFKRKSNKVVPFVV